MKIFMDEQGKADWHRLRLGVITASGADALITPLGKIRSGEGPETYLHLKLAEKMFGYSQAEVNGAGWAADQGQVAEKLAIPFYEAAYDREVTRVGFCMTDDGEAGASPDGLVGEDGGLEIKCAQPPNAVKYLLGGVVPSQYIVQVQFSLWVTKRAWWDFMSFSMGLPPLLVRVEPDPAMQATIGEVVRTFTAKLDAAHAKLAALMPRGGRAEA